MDDVRLFVHVLAATVWVGGQLVLAALVPALRAAGPDVPAAAARAFSRIAWPAFAVLILTGMWNIADAGNDRADGGGYQAVLVLKLTVVAISGVTAYLHSQARSSRSRGLYGTATGLSAVLALLLGVVLHD